MAFKFKPRKRGTPGSLLNNGQRAKGAAVAVKAYCTHHSEQEHDKLSNVSDIIADLGHFCDREGVDFHEALRIGQRDWNLER